MNRRLLLLATLLVLPTVAGAQRGGTKSRATDHDQMFDKDASPQGPSLRPRDVEDFSPLHLLIDKRKDLKLSDAQVDALKKSENTLKDKNAPLLKAIDSLVHELKPPMNMTPEAKDRMADAGKTLRETLQTISGNYDAASKDALATFDADQRSKATEMLAKLKEDGEKRVRDKMGEGKRG